MYPPIPLPAAFLTSSARLISHLSGSDRSERRQLFILPPRLKRLWLFARCPVNHAWLRPGLLRLLLLLFFNGRRDSDILRRNRRPGHSTPLADQQRSPQWNGEPDP